MTRPDAAAVPERRLEDRVRDRLAELDAGQLRRTLRRPSGIDLSSNDYLNLSVDPRVVDAFRAGAARDGCGSTGSRLLRGERQAFGDVEARFAAFKGTERALYFSSGYLANLAVLSTLPEAGDLMVSDERNHASLIDGSRLSRAQVIVAPHNDAAAVERVLVDRAGGGCAFVVVESLYSMDGDFAPLSDYAAVCRAHRATLVVDEAHAVGIYGERGSGLIELAGLDPNACVSINTAGKALGVSGAFVAGPAWAIDYLVQRARTFVFTTAAPPAVADAIQASLDIIEREPERRHRLLANARRLRDALGRERLAVSPGSSQIIPVMIGENDRAVAVAAALQAEGFDVRAIRPPSVPPGTARLRISVNAGLPDAVLDRFAARLAAETCCAASS